MSSLLNRPKVAVFCGSTTPQRPIYQKDAALLGEHLAAASFSILYGGGNQGLMGAVARHALALEGEVSAVTTTQELEMTDHLLPLKDVTLVESHSARKKIFFEEALAFIVLPGGWGTLDELTFLILEKKTSKTQKPLILLNTADFWGHFLTLMVSMTEEEFIEGKDTELFTLAHTPQEAIGIIQNELLG